ncbi:hypothetical protein HH007_07595 [Treponema denticola]|uniref:hypothetical protein n=1 Tax=Treponema denticola TaxID=158 RepID=UPI0002B5CC52|nr:hypothetical protein [Treponema denticola]EMB42851.1 hypothetical protein HMPREF9722_00647 [Treponema denticola ATCC 33520]
MKFRTNKNKGAAAFITAAFIVLTAALVFTGCPNSAGGSSSGGGNIDGVWKALSSTVNGGTPVPYPISNPNPGGGTGQLYYCFSEGKAYLAFKIEGNSNPGGNGLFKGDPWEEEYTFENNTLTLVGESLPFILTGNTATITIIEGSKTIVTMLERVSLPTVAEIKAAKEP